MAGRFRSSTRFIVGGLVVIGVVACAYVGVTSLRLAAKGERPCAVMDISGFSIDSELHADLQGRGVRDIVRTYTERSTTEATLRARPIVVKVFSGRPACRHEELKYVGRQRVRSNLDLTESGVRATQILTGFWGDARAAVMITSVVNGLGGRFPDYDRVFPQIGAGSLALTHLVVYDNGQYRIVDGPELTEMSFFKYGDPVPATEITVAHAVWQAGEPHWGAHQYRFERFVWNGKRYVGQPLGITKRKYSPTPNQEYRFVDTLLASEPDVLTPSPK